MYEAKDVEKCKKSIVRKRRNQKETLTPKTEVGKTKLKIRYPYTWKTYRKPSEQVFPYRRPRSYSNLNKI